MTKGEQRVLDALDEKFGNVNAVAELLRVSASYVHRIKNTHWQPITLADTTLPVPTTGSSTALSTKSIQVIPGLDSLREATIHYIKKLITTDTLPPNAAVKLLGSLLHYDVAIQQALTPVHIQDNRTQTVSYETLVTRLEELPLDKLRALGGVAEPLTIEGVTENVEKS